MTNQTITIPTKEGQLIKQGPIMPIESSGIESLLEAGMQQEFIKGSGQYVLLPEGTELLNKLFAVLEQYVCEPLGYKEVQLPKMAPIETFRTAEILGKWDDYLVAATPHGNTRGVTETYILDPLQCTTFYQFFQGKKVDVSHGATCWYDRSGPTYRNEDLDKIEPGIKQREYHRAEFIYLGTKEQVVTMREQTLSKVEQLCQDLGLRYRIVVGSGCYQVSDGEMKEAETLEEIPIKDLEIYLPQQDRWLEVVGSSVLREKETKNFNIRGTNGEELWSGCTGIGLERLLTAVVQYQTPLN